MQSPTRSHAFFRLSARERRVWCRCWDVCTAAEVAQSQSLSSLCSLPQALVVYGAPPIWPEGCYTELDGINFD